MAERAAQAGRRLRVGLFTGAMAFFFMGSGPSKEPTSASAGGDGSRRARPSLCSTDSVLTSEEDACPLLKHAHEVLSRLNLSAVNYVESVSCEFNLEGNVEIQQALLREDLIWQQKGFGPRQLDALVFVSVALAYQDADALLHELDGRLKEKMDAGLESRRQRVSLFRAQAFALLQSLSAQLKDLSARELDFRF